MKKIVFLYSGEGTSSRESSFKLLARSKHWPEIQSILSSNLELDLEAIWAKEIGKHRCPISPLLTVVCQICLSDIWKQWGYKPDVVIGHSIGELTAAFQAGFYSLEDILMLTYQIGQAAASLNGSMLHGSVSSHEMDRIPVNRSSMNFMDGEKKHLTLSGYSEEMEMFRAENPGFSKMRIPHPWHHPDYAAHIEKIKFFEPNIGNGTKFVSGVTADFESRLEPDHWRKWLVKPVDFISSMRSIEKEFKDQELEIVEIGFHPVLDKCCEIFDSYTFVSSMFRGEDEIQWIHHQRRLLDQTLFLEKLTSSIKDYRQELDFDTSLAYQGFTSLTFVEFSDVIQSFFPSLEPQDFYRFKTINQLINQFGAAEATPLRHTQNQIFQKNEVVISGMSCKFPSSVQNAAQFWQMLLSQEDQVNRYSSRGDYEAGFLNDEISSFDHRFFDIPLAEAATMDPQQILALELTELLWKDSGLDPNQLDRKRIGVYIGAWNQEFNGDKDSVYYPTGTNPSMIAARISYHYDLRGPSWVSNTACSSSLVAIHYAAKDIEDGRVDVAIAGGVNILWGNGFTDNMRNSGFLSENNRCKTFDNSADGYVRAEGGGLVLLVNKKLATKYYAELLGSSVNQNGGRSQIISAPHPEAQTDLILDACHDASILPQDISYIECHGTGTKIGDPIEMTAIHTTVAKGRNNICHVGSVKSNMGHLESAAGIAGLIKSVLILNHGLIPPNLHFNQPNEYIDFNTYQINVVSEVTEIDKLANIGISSFGFGGTNAHLIIRGVEDSVRKPIENHLIPFDKTHSPYRLTYNPIKNSEKPVNANDVNNHLPASGVAANDSSDPADRVDQTRKITREDVEKLVTDTFYQLTNIDEIDLEVELTEQGLDSMSVTALISTLESSLNIEIDPDIVFEYPLPDQLIDEIHALV